MSIIAIQIWIIGFLFTVGVYVKAGPESRWYDLPVILFAWPAILGGLLAKYMNETKRIDNLNVTIGKITTPTEEG